MNQPTGIVLMTTFPAEVKSISVKPDGVEIKLKIGFADGTLLQEIANMINQELIDITMAVRPAQPRLPFTEKATVQLEEETQEGRCST